MSLQWISLKTASAPSSRSMEATMFGVAGIPILLPSTSSSWSMVFSEDSERNMSRLTLDGVDIMGERLASEVHEVIARKPNLRKISFVAHSVGGLVARYAIGRLYRASIHGKAGDSLVDGCNEERGTTGGLKAMNFFTVATLHIGSRSNKQVPLLFGVAAFEKAASLVIQWIFRRTGEHLFLTDRDEGKPPKLQRMMEDFEDCYSMSALRSFKKEWCTQMWPTIVSFSILDSSMYLTSANHLNCLQSTCSPLPNTEQTLWVGKHHQSDVAMSFPSGRPRKIRSIPMLSMKNTARPVMVRLAPEVAWALMK